MLKLLCSMILLWGLMVSAQIPPEADAVFEHPVGTQDQGELDSLSQRLSQYTVLRASFSQAKKIKALRRPLVSKGQFLFAAERGVLWDIRTPLPTTFIISEKGIMQRDGESEPFIIEAEEHPVISGFTRVFMSLFRGDREELAERFELHFSGDANDWTIGLEPKGKIMARFLDRIILRGSEHLQTLYLAETSGDVTVIEFGEVQTEPPLSEAEIARFDF